MFCRGLYATVWGSRRLHLLPSPRGVVSRFVCDGLGLVSPPGGGRATLRDAGNSPSCYGEAGRGALRTTIGRPLRPYGPPPPPGEETERPRIPRTKQPKRAARVAPIAKCDTSRGRWTGTLRVPSSEASRTDGGKQRTNKPRASFPSRGRWTGILRVPESEGGGPSGPPPSDCQSALVAQLQAHLYRFTARRYRPAATSSAAAAICA